MRDEEFEIRNIEHSLRKFGSKNNKAEVDKETEFISFWFLFWGMQDLNMLIYLIL